MNKEATTIMTEIFSKLMEIVDSLGATGTLAILNDIVDSYDRAWDEYDEMPDIEKQLKADYLETSASIEDFRESEE